MKFSNPRFNEKYVSSMVVLRDGTEFPLANIFDRNPSTFDIRGVRCPQHPDIVSYAKGWSVWDGSRHVLTRMALGVSEAFLCAQDFE